MPTEFIPDAGLCITTLNVLEGRGAVRWMVRGEPHAPGDTGWQIMSHLDTEEYLDNPDHWAVVDFNTVCGIEPALIGIWDLPTGSDLQLVRDDAGIHVVDTPSGREIPFEELYDPSRAIPAPSMMREGDVMRQIGRFLHADIPAGYDAIEATFAILGFTGTFSAVAIAGDRRESVMPNPDAFGLAAELRDLAYRPGVGTWYSATLTVTAQGGFDASFDHDGEPRLPQPVDHEHYVRDAERYPRDAEHTPAWLTQRLAESPTSPAAQSGMRETTPRATEPQQAAAEKPARRRWFGRA